MSETGDPNAPQGADSACPDGCLIAFTYDDLETAKAHLGFLESFGPEFVPSLLAGEIALYSDQAHDSHLAAGLRRFAGSD